MEADRDKACFMTLRKENGGGSGGRGGELEAMAVVSFNACDRRSLIMS